jgi:hypothetical protein
MKKNKWLLGENPDSNPLEDRVDQIHAKLREMDPQGLANRTGAIYIPTGDARGEFELVLWARKVILNFPELTAKDAQSGKPLNTFDQAVLAYYLHVSDGKPKADKWIAFTELPDGKFYTQAFQGYTGGELVKVFGNNLEAFMAAAQNLGGRREFFGDAAFSFKVLPRISIMVACWQGDEDFPPSYKILFDAAAGHHLTTDALAIMGSQLTRNLIKASKEQT